MKNMALENLRTALGKTSLQMLDSLSETHWYDFNPGMVNDGDAITKTFPTRKEAIEAFMKEGEYYSSLLGEYVSKLSNKGDMAWLQALVSTGTSADRVSALVLLVQQCPLGRIEMIKALMKLGEKRSRREGSIACAALKDLFINDLLPSDKGLHFLADQPKLKVLEVSPTSKTEQRPKSSLKVSLQSSLSVTYCYRPSDLILFWFEDFLKTAYAKFVLILSNGVKDPLDFFKRNCMKYSFELLVSCPEQEKALVTVLVLKLMDSSSQDAALAYSLLRQLLGEHHPSMKPFVASQIVGSVLSKLATGGGSTSVVTAAYRPVLFLSELQYHKTETEFIKYMVNAFLNLFHYLINRIKQSDDSRGLLKQQKLHKRKLKLAKKRRRGNTASLPVVDTHSRPSSSHEENFDSNNKLLGAVLNGLTRAIPYLRATDLPDMTDDWNALDRLVECVTSTRVRISLFSVLYRLLVIMQKDPDGLFKLLYREMKQFSLLSGTNRKVFLSITKKLVETDSNLDRPLSIYRRLNQVTLHTEFSFLQLGLLFELFKVISKHPSWALPIVTASDRSLVEDSGEEICRDHDEEEEEKVAQKSYATTTHVPSLTEEVLPFHRGYNPRNGDPKYARPDMSHLWELDLQCCSICPSISTYATSLKQWAFAQAGPTVTREERHPIPELRTVLPYEELQSEGNIRGNRAPDGLLDVLSASTILELLSYKQPNGSKSKNKSLLDADTDRLGERKTSSSLSRVDTMSINSFGYWRQKRRIYPHENFLALYFKDEHTQRRLQKEKRDQGEDSAARIEWAGSSQEEEPDEDDDMDAFLDDVLAKEMGTEEGEGSWSGPDSERSDGVEDDESSGETFMMDDEEDADCALTPPLEVEKRHRRVPKLIGAFASADDYNIE